MGLLERLGITKQASLTEQVSEVSGAWRDAYGEQNQSWVDEVYDDHVIICAGADHYSVPFSRSNVSGDIEFSVVDAVEVQREWAPVAKTVVIEKTDDDRQLAFGWAYVMEKDGQPVTDHSGEFIEAAADLEDAAYVFNLEYREGDERHTEEVKAHLVESFMVTPEKLEAIGLAKDALPLGWWTGWYLPDPETFAKVKDGTYPMLSIGGVAIREAVNA